MHRSWRVGIYMVFVLYANNFYTTLHYVSSNPGFDHRDMNDDRLVN